MPASRRPDRTGQPEVLPTGGAEPPTEAAGLAPHLRALLERPGWRARVDDLTGGLLGVPAGRSAGIAAAVVVVVALAVWRLASGAGGGLAAVPMVSAPPTTALGASAGPPPGAAPEAATTTGPTSVVVHAAGAVNVPGLHTLPGGARLGQLIEAAGGPAPDADLDRVNLAAPLVDGSRHYVPRRGETSPPLAVEGSAPPGQVDGAPPAAGSGGPVSLSTATQAELEALPGIGPATAMAIIEHRTRHGGFRSVEQLLDVRGIGEARLATLRPLVVP